jgi:hypothetical protein
MVIFGRRFSVVFLVGAATALSAPAPPVDGSADRADAAAASAGCLTCHTATDAPTMHENPAVVLGCTDCHGGDATVDAAGAAVGSRWYDAARRRAHVAPAHPMAWGGSRNPERTYTLLNDERPEFVRFVNPSDLRVAREVCGSCHRAIVEAQERSLMATGAMLWGGAAYNNGVLPYKRYLLGEAYTRDGDAASIDAPVPVDANMASRSLVDRLVPLPAFEVVPAADPWRVFEPGGVAPTGAPEVALAGANPQEAGRPSIPVSGRARGTGLAVSGGVLNIHKTRLNDPLLWFLGTNDQPGDYRSSGCAACHVPYANDRDPAHSGPWAEHGHDGGSASIDPTIPRGEPGHPVAHRFTRAIPTSQCMVCHMHQPNVFVNSYLGFTMWDYEADAPSMWPAEQHDPGLRERRAVHDRNPEGAASRGSWRDTDFLGDVSTLNPTLEHTQFADYHGHGWNFRAVHKKDEAGHLLDADGAIVPHDAPDKWERAVQLTSVHLDVGMHCVDCHFAQDAHGSGHIATEVAAAVEVQCVDCHGTADRRPTLRTSGPAAPPGGTDLTTLRTPDGLPRFEWQGESLIQRSALWPGRSWTMSQVRDTVDPDHPAYNPRAARSKLVSDDGSLRWGPGVDPAHRAHDPAEMACQTCHTSWTTSCSGCHLNGEANVRSPMHHYERRDTRGFATYNPQVVRDDVFMLGRHGDARGGIVAPIRSSSALMISSTDARDRRVVHQQPPISAGGFSSQAFAPHYPHTERKTETKTCTDCHLAADGSNNARLAQLFTLGTGAVSFVGHVAWVGGDGGLSGVTVTEWTEPQAVLGSWFHGVAYPKDHADLLARDRVLPDAVHEPGGRTGCLQARGEWLFAAEGARGLQVYDIAAVDHLAVADRVTQGPFRRDLSVETPDARCVALPTTQPVNPAWNRREIIRSGASEQEMRPIYDYAVVADAELGLVFVHVTELVDGDPRTDDLDADVVFDGGGVLRGARDLLVAGDVIWVAADVGVVAVDVSDPTAPAVRSVLPVADPRGVALQFRYLFVTTAYGLEVVDVTHPDAPRLVDGALVPLTDAHRLYVARTYAYVAGGTEGLVVIDVQRPERPALARRFDADGRLADVRDVAIGATYTSFYAYVADARAGLAVVQLVSPGSTPGFYGFSPEPEPELVARYPTSWPALAVSRGLERDRGVDETGGQIAVFGRYGSRPFTLPEMQSFYLDDHGDPWTVTDDVRLDLFVPAEVPP